MITFSGIDCAGKSTQIDIFKAYLESQGKRCRVIWSRGGYTSWVEGIKTLLRKDKAYTEEQKEEYRKEFNQSTRKTKLLLWASICDLIRYYGIVLRFIEATGTLILCDRYIWDTYIDFKLKYPQYDFENWLSWKLMIRLIKQPKCSIIFTIPVEVSMRRSVEKNDPHSEPYDLRLQRIKLYEKEIEKRRWQHVIDAMKPKEEVARQVKEAIGGTIGNA